MWRMLVARPHHPRLLEARGCPARYTTSGGREQRGRVLTEAAEAGGPWHGRWQQYLSTVASSSSKYAAAPPGQPLAAQQPDKQHSKVRGNSWSPPPHDHHKRRSTRRFVITEKAPARTAGLVSIMSSWILKCESSSSRLQPEEGPSWGLLRDYEPYSCGPPHYHNPPSLRWSGWGHLTQTSLQSSHPGTAPHIGSHSALCSYHTASVMFHTLQRSSHSAVMSQCYNMSLLC